MRVITRRGNRREEQTTPKGEREEDNDEASERTCVYEGDTRACLLVRGRVYVGCLRVPRRFTVEVGVKQPSNSRGGAYTQP